MAKAGRGADQYMLRLPEGLRDRIKADADANGRSMNTEIVARIESTFIGHAQAPLLRALIALQEDLLLNRIEVDLPKTMMEQVEKLAEDRGWTVDQMMRELVLGGLRHADAQTPVGERLAAEVMKQEQEED